MNMARTGKQKNGLFLAQFAVDQAHSEFWVEIWVATNASDLEINLVFLNMVCKQAVNLHHIDSFVHILGNFLK